MLLHGGVIVRNVDQQRLVEVHAEHVQRAAQHLGVGPPTAVAFQCLEDRARRLGAMPLGRDHAANL